MFLFTELVPWLTWLTSLIYLLIAESILFIINPRLVSLICVHFKYSLILCAWRRFNRLIVPSNVSYIDRLSRARSKFLKPNVLSRIRCGVDSSDFKSPTERWVEFAVARTFTTFETVLLLSEISLTAPPYNSKEILQLLKLNFVPPITNTQPLWMVLVSMHRPHAIICLISAYFTIICHILFVNWVLNFILHILIALLTYLALFFV